MTKGRPPNIALDEAAVIAKRRGEVEVIPGTRSDAFDLILFEEHRTIFVRVKRSLTQFFWVPDILRQYQREIVHLLRIPLTTVTAREFWVRHPKGNWQFFLVRHDTVIEIRADGTYTPSAELPIITGEPTGGVYSPGGDEDSTSENER
jgi:hypothetical protein